MVYSHGGRKSSSFLGSRCTFVASDLDRRWERKMGHDDDIDLRKAMVVLCGLPRTTEKVWREQTFCSKLYGKYRVWHQACQLEFVATNGRDRDFLIC